MSSRRRRGRSRSGWWRDCHQLPHQQGMAGVGGICDLPPAGAVPGAASPGAAPRAGAYQAGAPLVQGVGQHGGISLLVGPADLAGLQIFLSGPGAGMRRGRSEGAGAGGTAGVRQDPGGDGGRAEPVEHAIVLRGVRYSGAGQDSGPPAANRGSLAGPLLADDGAALPLLPGRPRGGWRRTRCSPGKEGAGLWTPWWPIRWIR